MIQPIIKDEAFLSISSEPAAIEDLPVAQDLLDTLSANADRCVGLAANMIGISKRIIAADDAGNGKSKLSFRKPPPNIGLMKPSSLFCAGNARTSPIKTIRIEIRS